MSWKETRLDGELCLRTPRETASLTPFFSHLDSWYYNYSASTSSSAHGAPNRFSNSTMASSLLDPFNNPSFVLHPQTSRTSSQPVASSSSQTGSTPYDADAEHYRLSLGSSSSSDLSKMFPDIPPELLTFVGDEESSTPRMAPDCSACGIRLDYMRYTCLKVGFQSRQVSRTLKLTLFFVTNYSAASPMANSTLPSLLARELVLHALERIATTMSIPKMKRMTTATPQTGPNS